MKPTTQQVVMVLAGKLAAAEIELEQATALNQEAGRELKTLKDALEKLQAASGEVEPTTSAAKPERRPAASTRTGRS